MRRRRAAILSLDRPRLAAVLIALVWVTPAASVDWVRKQTGEGWTWFEDYAYVWATYRVACEPGRLCQIGMGIFAFGQPRGEKISYSGEREILVVGFGSLHIRPADGRGPVKAAIGPKDAGLFPIGNWDL